MIEYRGYVGVVEYDPDIESFFGRVVNSRDVMTFYGTSVEELRIEMAKTVDVYIEMMDERGEEPPKPLSGDFLVRTGDPALHGMLTIAAARAGDSLNAYVVRVLHEHLARRAIAEGSLLLGDQGAGPHAEAGIARAGARKTRGPKRRARSAVGARSDD